MVVTQNTWPPLRLNLKLQGARIWVLLVHPNVGIVEDHLTAPLGKLMAKRAKPSPWLKKTTVYTITMCLTTCPKLHVTSKIHPVFYWNSLLQLLCFRMINSKKQITFKGQFNLPFFIVHPTASTERYGNIWWESPWTCWIRCWEKLPPNINWKSLAAKGFLEDFSHMRIARRLALKEEHVRGAKSLTAKARNESRMHHLGRRV